MGLLVTDVTLRDFRSFERLELALAERVTILVGPNAVGKTNTVEAVQLLTSGASFRRPAPAQLVREGAESARIDARLVGDGRVLDHRCDVTASRSALLAQRQALPRRRHARGPCPRCSFARTTWRWSSAGPPCAATSWTSWRAR